MTDNPEDYIPPASQAQATDEEHPQGADVQIGRAMGVGTETSPSHRRATASLRVTDKRLGLLWVPCPDASSPLSWQGYRSDILALLWQEYALPCVDVEAQSVAICLAGQPQPDWLSFSQAVVAQQGGKVRGYDVMNIVAVDMLAHPHVLVSERAMRRWLEGVMGHALPLVFCVHPNYRRQVSNPRVFAAVSQFIRQKQPNLRVEFWFPGASKLPQ